jgi:hypothetical protein
MRLRILGLASLAALMAVAVAAASPAGAQTSGNQTSGNQTTGNQTTVKKKPADAPARVTVQKRSFLDAGTEVLPGQRKFTDYAFPPGYSPTQSIDYTSGNVRGPLIGPWDTSRHNFYPW